MNWDQIESNWSAMARRVRPDRTAVTETGLAKSDLTPQPGLVRGTGPDLVRQSAGEEVTTTDIASIK